MASDTKNVKLGVCSVTFDGADLGYTKGGVEVEVTTETKSVEVDQFGKSPIDEVIMGRVVSAKVPLAETTLENMARTMPGSSLVATGAVKATGTITFAAVGSAADTVTVNGVVFTAASAGPFTGNKFKIGASATETAANLAAKLNASTDYRVVQGKYTPALGVITVEFDDAGVLGNNFTLAKSGTDITVSGAKLTGGVDATVKRVDVTNAVGTSLLKGAKKLVFHPQSLPAEDKSEDFIIPLANTAGNLQFAYKLEDERIFNLTFKGYPNPTTRTLFQVGDEDAA